MKSEILTENNKGKSFLSSFLGGNLVGLVQCVPPSHSSINTFWINKHHPTPKLQKSNIYCLQRGAVEKRIEIEYMHFPIVFI